MTLNEYSKIVGLNLRKVFRFSRYSNGYNSLLTNRKYKDLSLSVQQSIKQVEVNLKEIKKNKVPLLRSIALQKSGFKIYSKEFRLNILGGFNVNSHNIIDSNIKDEHIQLLIDITDAFIKN